MSLTLLPLRLYMLNEMSKVNQNCVSGLHMLNMFEVLRGGRVVVLVGVEEIILTHCPPFLSINVTVLPLL